MSESWIKQSGPYTYRYDINRPHNTATMRILTPDGVRKIWNADRSLLEGKLTETALLERGYQRI